MRFEPADWLDIVMGSGLRRTAEALSNGAARVRSSNERWASEHGIDTLRSGGNYALAVKSASHIRSDVVDRIGMHDALIVSSTRSLAVQARRAYQYSSVKISS